MNGTDDNSIFLLTDASSATTLTPVISDVDKNANTFSITSPAAAFTSFRYTTDGTITPTTSVGTVTDGTNITIPEVWQVQAVGICGSFVTPVAGPKTLVPATQCDPPTLTYSHEDKTVTIAPTWPTDATLKYALNGTDAPDKTYIAPVTIPNDCDIVRAIASKTGLDDSPIASITRVATPTFGFDDAAQGFTVTCATEGATIFYTTDGSEPTTSSTEYSGAVAISRETTVKAIAVKDGYIYSTIAENTYTKTAAPTITFDQYTNTFTLGSTTDGATIHYTTDGTEPTTSSSTYSEAVSLTAASTIKAIAVKAGMVNSTVETKAIGKSNTPVITFSGDDQITITTDPAGAEVYYTKSSTVPTNTSGTLYSSAFDLSSTEDVVQAVAYEADKVSSDVATMTVVVHMGSDETYLIQNQNNAWTTGDHQGCHYYMIPGDENTGNVNTTSLFRSTMEWYFKYAGNDGTYDYYYIVNKNSTGDIRLRYNTNIYLEEYASANDDSFKFRIWEYNSTGSYNIIPKGLTSGNMYVHKGNNNNNAASVTLNDKRTGNSLWKFVKKTALDTTAPFEVSTDETVHYYKINNSNASTYYIVPPGSLSAYATTSNAESDQMNWYFKEAGTTDNGWLTYYHIINGVTGEYLYYTGGATYATTTACFEMRRDYDSSNAERYQFTWARSTTADVYFIVPAMLKDEALNTISSILQRKDNPLATDKNRNVGNLTWKFVESTMTLATPNIYYDAANNKVEIICTTPDVTAIYYTTDGSDPATSDTKLQYEGKFLLDEGINTVKAVAVKGAEPSNVTTKKIPVQTTTTNGNRPYLIRNNGNAWSEGDPFFYIIPDTYNGNANTASMPRPTMEWYFLDAGLDGNGSQCFYIKNAVAKSADDKELYLHRNGGTISIKEIDETDTGFKFYLIERTTGYSIVAYGTTNVFLTKSNWNNQTNALNTSNSTTSDASLWNFVLKKALDTTSPIEESSDDNDAHYYKIRSNRTDDNTFSIISPETGTTYPTVSSTAEEVKKSWYFKNAGTDGWVTYYNIVYAETGEYLRCTATQANTYNQNVRPFELSTVDDERSQFVLVKSTFEGSYFIVPKIYKDTQLNNICSIVNRDDTYMRTDVNRNLRANTWIFETADMFCVSPVFSEENEDVIITCITPASEIRYTTNGEDPAANGVIYSIYPPAEPFSSSDKMVIKACAVVSDGTNTATSGLVTLLNKPDITYTPETYTYKGAAWEPTVTDVSVTVSENKTSAPTSPVTYRVTYADNINAGEATITIEDANDDDNWYIWNGSTTFTIEPKPLTITAGSDTKVYDGTPLTNDSYTSKDDSDVSPGLIESDSFERVTITGSQTNAGSSGNVPSGAVIKNGSNEDMTANYDITYENGTLTVKQKSIGNGTNPASDIDVSIGAENAIILTYGEITLAEGSENDYTINEATISASGRYSLRTITANEKGNYTGSFKARNAIVNFQTDDKEAEWSATFVAEPAGADDDPSVAADNAKGHALPNGITAYVITKIDGDVAVAEALDYVPEGIPVLLLSNAASGGFFVKDASGQTAITTEQTSSNLLKEVTDESLSFNVRTIYLLYQNEFVYNMPGDLEKGKVYLNPNHSGNGTPAPSRLKIRKNTETGTGIDSVTEESISDAKKEFWYTLDGRRLNGKPQRRGLYITREKKVIVR